MNNVTFDTDNHASWVEEVDPDELRRIVDALHRVHQFVSCMIDLDTLLERIMVESKAVAHAEACSLMLYDPRREELYFRVALGEHGDQQVLKKEVQLKLGQGIAGLAAAERRSINVEDAQHDDRVYRSADELSHFESRSILAVPMIEHDQLIGVIEVLNKLDGDPFTEADLHVMEIFANAAATAIINARLIEENLRSERLAAIGEAMAGLSHYAKNLITGLTGSIDLIEYAYNRNDEEALGRSWPILRRSCQRLSDFVEDMLTYSKPRKPEIGPCAVRPLLEEAIATAQGMFTHKQVAIRTDTDDIEDLFPLDGRGFFRALLNVLKNAAEAAPDNTGEIVVSAHHPSDGVLVIAVEDNGPGVPAEIRNQVCDPFFSTKSSRGTGLGLAVTYKIVREHKGVLDIEDRPGGGAVFRMTIPAHRGDA